MQSFCLNNQPRKRKAEADQFDVLQDCSALDPDNKKLVPAKRRFDMRIMKEISTRWIGSKGPNDLQMCAERLGLQGGPQTMREFLLLLTALEIEASKFLGEGKAADMIAVMFDSVKH